jgi:hypothetical protein
MKYFNKLGEDKGSNISEGLALGAISGLASTTATHPIEHKLYGKGKNFFGHLGARLGKGIMASAVGYGTYHYLANNKEKIKEYTQNVKDSYSK